VQAKAEAARQKALAKASTAEGKAAAAQAKAQADAKARQREIEKTREKELQKRIQERKAKEWADYRESERQATRELQAARQRERDEARYGRSMKYSPPIKSAQPAPQSVQTPTMQPPPAQPKLTSFAASPISSAQPQTQPTPQPQSQSQPTPQPQPQPQPQANYEGEFNSYGFDRPLLDYLNNQQRLSTFDAGISYSYDPATQTFTGGTRGSGPFTKTLQEMQAESQSKSPFVFGKPYKKGGQVKAAQDTKKKYTSGGKINLNECRVSTAKKNKTNLNW
jgi:hypothetical protein